ncbi:hypothetical protein [Hymenobacter coccineus]|uniref:Uncharacterized protein n=1 Tax=Hymenobacter coccineus TaxID=1908235 RepID=A0A1G1SVX4_9BACT|nr:hypothetical protein [Hymenobacter coccineus]OGX82769.1 hypothetical protein BEN49_02575 [Hymenobacter coccineus]
MLLAACNEPARQPTTEVPAALPSGVPGTASGPRPSDSALNAPAQTQPVSLNPTAEAAAAVDSAAIPAVKNVPFVGPPTVKRALNNGLKTGSN